MKNYHRTESKAKDKRIFIVESAIKLFLRKGVQGTSMRDIAKSVEMTTSNLYHYFQSKDEIIDLAAEINTQSLVYYQEYYRSLGDISLSEALRKIIMQLVLLADKNHDMAVFCTREYLNFSPARASLLSGLVNEYIIFFEGLLNEGIRTGEFKVENPRLVAFNIWVLQQEWAMRRWFWRGKITAEEFAKQQADLILGSIMIKRYPPVEAPRQKIITDQR